MHDNEFENEFCGGTRVGLDLAGRHSDKFFREMQRKYWETILIEIDG